MDERDMLALNECERKLVDYHFIVTLNECERKLVEQGLALRAIGAYRRRLKDDHGIRIGLRDAKNAVDKYADFLYMIK